MGKKILIIEDEPGLVVALRDRLQSEGYTVETAQDGVEGLNLATRNHFDLIILDLMLPQKSGLDVCRELRQQSFSTPVIMLTARSQTIDKVIGLKIGADDYITKPFEMLELLARVEALLRRNPQNGGAVQAIYQFGSIQVDFRRTEVTRKGVPVLLSAREFQLLKYLIEHRETTLSRNDLLKDVWGYGAFTVTRTVDVHIASLRQKLEEDPKHPRFILTVLGFGYKFVG
ncbi:MAG TPA: response regulator transcription factor [Terriglobia bacterium]|jgi:two-component system alkaline phosphatase synthesis response regulator PhoP|nr:response regulator transcription factor [Terriglobia bacterium]